MEENVHKVAVFASGNGTNAEKLFQYFEKHHNIEIAVLLTNKPGAGVIDRAENYNIPVEIFDKHKLQNTREVLTLLNEFGIEWIVLAGFLLKIPEYLVKAYSDKIINIHPALLPKYGGKGMYGKHVHKAVLEAGEDETGITIHYANEEYDKGAHIFQAKCKVEKNDTPESLAEKVKALEHYYLPRVVESTILNINPEN